MILDSSHFVNTATEAEISEAYVVNTARREELTKVQVHSIIENEPPRIENSLWNNPFFSPSRGKEVILDPLWSNPLLLAPITELDLTSRSFRILKLENIQCIGELIQCSDADILSFPNLGAGSLREIKAALKTHGLKLGTKLEHWYLPDLLLPIESLDLPDLIAKNLKLMDILYVGDLVIRRNYDDFQRIHFDAFSQIFHALNKKGLYL